MRADSWTDERIALLRTLWAEGATARAIAERLGGVSRAAVLGKVSRLRLDAAFSVPAAVQPDAKARHDSKADGAGAASLVRRRLSKRNDSRTAASPAGARGKSLFELSNESCRWIVQAGIRWLVSTALSHLH